MNIVIQTLKDILITALMVTVIGLIIGGCLRVFYDWPFKEAFWVGYMIGIVIDILIMSIVGLIKWRKRRRDRVYLTGKPRYGKH